MNLYADPRALRRAQNAETQRMRRANRGSLEEENDQRRTRRIIPGVQDTIKDLSVVVVGVVVGVGV